MAILIDTSVFVEAERRRLTLDQLVLVAPQDEYLVMSAMTVAELLFGLHAAIAQPQREERAAFIESVIDRIPSLPFDAEVARVYAEVWARLRNTGNLIAPHDLMIGCTAVVHGLAVLTHNARDFSRIPGLEVRQPSW